MRQKERKEKRERGMKSGEGRTMLDAGGRADEQPRKGKMVESAGAQVEKRDSKSIER